jgi:hypothetical protein
MTFLSLPLGFMVILKTPTFTTFHNLIKKIWFRFQPLMHFCQHFHPTCFLITTQIFYAMFANTFLKLKYCVAIWWTIHNQYSVHQHRGWEAATVSHPFTKTLCNKILYHITESLLHAFWISLQVLVASPIPTNIKLRCLTLHRIILLHFYDTVTRHTSVETTIKPHVSMLIFSNFDSKSRRVVGIIS